MLWVQTKSYCHIHIALCTAGLVELLPSLCLPSCLQGLLQHCGWWGDRKHHSSPLSPAKILLFLGSLWVLPMRSQNSGPHPSAVHGTCRQLLQASMAWGHGRGAPKLVSIARWCSCYGGCPDGQGLSTLGQSQNLHTSLLLPMVWAVWVCSLARLCLPLPVWAIMYPTPSVLPGGVQELGVNTADPQGGCGQSGGVPTSLWRYVSLWSSG